MTNMTPQQVQELIEKAKAAADPMLGEFIDIPYEDKMIIRGPCREFVNFIAPNKILTLAQNYLKALDVIKAVATKVTWHDPKNQEVILTYGFDVQAAQNFLKKIGHDASEGGIV